MADGEGEVTSPLAAPGASSNLCQNLGHCVQPFLESMTGQYVKQFEAQQGHVSSDWSESEISPTYDRLAWPSLGAGFNPV